MGSTPQPANSPLSQAADASYSGPMAGWMAPMQALEGVAAGQSGSQIQQHLAAAAQNMQQPSGMAPPPQPQAGGSGPQSAPGQAGSVPQSAPITQQLQQATQPGANGFASNMPQPMQQYYQNPYAQVLGGWR